MRHISAFLLVNSERIIVNILLVTAKKKKEVIPGQNVETQSWFKCALFYRSSN